MLFFLTIIFGCIYCLYYFGPGPSSDEELRQELASIKSAQVAAQPKAPTSIDLAFYVKDPSHVASGKSVFEARCVVCHGPQGQGLIGPNLTDTSWIHGGKLSEIKNTIENGVLDKGLLAWKGVLSPDEINNVVAYVHSLKGTNPPNPKAAQGVVVDGDE